MFTAITNTPRNYAWGSKLAIAELLGREPSGGPEAEFWLGTHPSSPSTVVQSGEPLSALIGGGLPFLLKVLAAGEPLSLQAHPTTEQAAAGFTRENAAGIPLGAPNRNYKDSSHKPELIYALSDPFRALCGFRSVEATRAILAPAANDPRINQLLKRLVDDASLPSVFEWLINGGSEVDELIAAVGVHDGPGEEWKTVRRLRHFYPADPAVAISLLLNTVTLRPGEVLYLPAGNIHAYLEGVGIELMASSDNVLRGGLSPKQVDVPELLSVLDFRPLPVPRLAPEGIAPGVELFRPDVSDFLLIVVGRDGADDTAPVTVPAAGPAIALCIGGSFSLTGSRSSAAIQRGESLFVSAEEGALEVAGNGTLFLATGGSADGGSN
jgi:mannose-6-phosphate isomerase